MRRMFTERLSLTKRAWDDMYVSGGPRFNAMTKRKESKERSKNGRSKAEEERSAQRKEKKESKECPHGF